MQPATEKQKRTILEMLDGFGEDTYILLKELHELTTFEAHKIIKYLTYEAIGEMPPAIAKELKDALIFRNLWL